MKFIYHLSTAILFLIVLTIPWVKFQLFYKLTITECLFVLFILLTLIQYAQGNRSFTKREFPPVILLASISLFCLAFFLSGIDAPYQTQFLLESAAVVYVILFGIAVSIFLAQNEKYLLMSLQVVKLSVVTVSIFGIIGLLYAAVSGIYTDLIFSRSHRLISTFRLPNQLAGFFVLFMPLLWENVTSKKTIGSISIHAALFLSAVIGLIATGSRAGVASLFIIAFLFSIHYFKQYRVQVVTAAVVLLAGLLFITVTLVPKDSILVRGFTFLQSIGSGSSIIGEFHSNNWALALKLFQDNPVNGYGFGNVFKDYQYEIHNTYLSVLAELGLIGFIPFAILVISILYYAFKNVSIAKYKENNEWLAISRGLLYGLIGFLAFANFNMMLRTRYFWVAIGLIFTVSSLLRLKQRESLN